MAVAKPPDPRDFKAWEDAFQHPLPTVRKFEQQLRSNAAENREKLRSLVGTSYRDLLGTAERICDMDERMQTIENTLGTTASKCNSTVVEKIFSNAAVLDAQRRSQGSKSMAAQLAILRNCQSAMTHLLKQDGTTYVTSKVLVLARLLHKTLSQQPDVPPVVDSLRNRLASLRAKLLRSIDWNFSNPDLESHQLVANMGAFSLATSSSPTDVLRHFLRVRLEAVRSCATSPHQARDNMIKAIRLFRGALTVVHSVFPKRLAEALSRLKLHPLLQDKEVQSLAELNLDVLGRWIADEVRNYTPWPRHDELTKSEAENITRSWLPAATDALRQVSKSVLGEQSDLEEVLKLREDVIAAHLSAPERAPGFDSSGILDMLREVFNDRLADLAEAQVKSIANLSRQIESDLQSWSTQATQTGSLWGLADDAPSLERGAFGFKEAVRDRLHSNDIRTKSCMGMSETWASSISNARALTKVARERRWEDDLLDAAADAEDSFDLDSKQALLGVDDPRSLEEALSSALESSLATFHKDFGQSISKADSLPKSVFLLRILRDLAQKVDALDKVELNHALLSQPLYETISVKVGDVALQTHKAALLRLARGRLFTQSALWEGHPPLPTQPSSPVFRFLVQTTREMAAAGQDLWSPGLVNALKTRVMAQLALSFEEAIVETEHVPTEPAQVAEVNGTSGEIGKSDAMVNGVSEDLAEDTAEKSDGEENPVNGEPGSADGDPKEAKGDTTDAQENSAASDQNGEADSSEKADAAADVEKELEPNGTNAEVLREGKLKQMLFDALYLRRVLQVGHPEAKSSSASRETLDWIATRLREESKVDAELADRIQKSSAEYWRKTYLLFGLLA